jgi:hypothetical protein
MRSPKSRSQHLLRALMLHTAEGRKTREQERKEAAFGLL